MRFAGFAQHVHDHLVGFLHGRAIHAAHHDRVRAVFKRGAALAAKQNIAAADLAYPALRSRLEAQGQVLDLTPWQQPKRSIAPKNLAVKATPEKTP